MVNLFIGEQKEVIQAALGQAGFKFAAGGSHISRTLMLAELRLVLDAVPMGSTPEGYRTAILVQNALAKRTESTRQKSLRHLRELYSLSEAVPIFAALRRLNAADPNVLPLLAILCAWCRDPLLRATTPAVLLAREGSEVTTKSLAYAVADAFPGQYSDLNQNKVARNAASTWTQSGHLVGRAARVRRRVQPTFGAVTMALWLGDIAGFHGASCFANPWCRLLDLSPDQAKARATDAHRHGLLTLRSVGEIVELNFPGLPSSQGVVT